ncbi:unnamed protein product [Gongylonema pulchrum]|uniref:RRM domain-containing protein n=1 Tax=Gongylonema pulchrum TaxID=637853 RepID=A0A3P6S2X1_9BILA|nr:unnamed protein product [Gongylonema pulchrum]
MFHYYSGNFSAAVESGAAKETKPEVAVDETEKVQKSESNCEDGADNENEEEDESFLTGTTLFVKNLSFKTTDEALKKKFESHFRIRSASVSKKRGKIDLVHVFFLSDFYFAIYFDAGASSLSYRA